MEEVSSQAMSPLWFQT